MKLRKANKKDVAELIKLYRATAECENGIARTPKEVTKFYVEHFLQNALKKGLIFVIEQEKKLIAEIHGYPNEPLVFRHTLGNLTMVVHPDFQGQGLGRKIFSHFLNKVEKKHTDIARVELFTRQSNKRGIALYKSLGFESEGFCKKRILNAEGKLELDTIMAWFNPNFKGEKAA